MPTSESRLSYPDAEKFLQAALDDATGARKPFTTRGAANHFRVRVNMYRKIMRMDNAKIYPDAEHPMHGRCEYDAISIAVRGPDESGEWWVYAERYDVGDEAIEPLSEISNAS
jgi:hypothetical protein